MFFNGRYLAFPWFTALEAVRATLHKPRRRD